MTLVHRSKLMKQRQPLLPINMIVFAGHTPHSPLLLPSINKEKMHVVEKTVHAMKDFADELYASHPDTIVLISEHPTSYPSTFSINVKDPYTFNLKEFGQLQFEKTLHPDIATIDALQRHLRRSEQSITLTSDQDLHFASAVPLSYITDILPKIRLIPITPSNLDAKAHFHFGQEVKEILEASSRRIAIISSGDMSHALNESSPAGFDPAGEEYDKRIMDLINTKNTAGFLSIDEELLENAKATNYKQMCILLGILDGIATSPVTLSYEAPFHVGYLTTIFEIP